MCLSLAAPLAGAFDMDKALDLLRVVGMARQMRRAKQRDQTRPMKFQFDVRDISLVSPKTPDRPLYVKWK